jgi:hypothetical protein
MTIANTSNHFLLQLPAQIANGFPLSSLNSLPRNLIPRRHQACDVFALANGRDITEGLTYGFFISAPQAHQGFDAASEQEALVTSISQLHSGF